MMKLRVLLWIVALSQLVLGTFTLLFPTQFFVLMGLTAPPADNKYMLGMLSARFIAYGLAFVALARAEIPDPRWIRNMVLIQLIDFGAGLYYVLTGVIGFGIAGFPMFNAALFATLLWLWQPNASSNRGEVSALQS